MIRIREALVVEGRYDKAALASLVDTVIVETHGFGIFRDRERLAYLRRLAERRGLLILTDSDGAGFVIRNHLKSAIPASQCKQAFIPSLFGKERRKAQPSKAGTLGVEGMTPEVLLAALRRAGATIEGEDCPPPPKLKKSDLYALGLSGARDSAEKRSALCKRLGLPAGMTASALLDAVGSLYTYEEFIRTAKELSDAGK
ncbi:MAG: DUF4093 domain-containing protein [Clostridiaceae bacterium]|nr:DUF4093 domain-containing protein [Clostridiaceae bacterium]